MGLWGLQNIVQVVYGLSLKIEDLESNFYLPCKPLGKHRNFEPSKSGAMNGIRLGKVP